MMDFALYKKMMSDALDTVDPLSVVDMTTVLAKAAASNTPVYVFGNGGSASVAEHFSCDHNKGIIMDTPLTPNIVSLSSNMALLSAIANDIGYEEVFSKQLEHNTNDDAVVVAISSSGNSKNIVKGLDVARRQGLTTIALVGFDGGTVKRNNMADIIIHVKSNNYGIVEDSHSVIMHSTAQSIRTMYMRDGLDSITL